MTSKAASALRGAPGARVRLVMMGMVLTLLAAIGVSAWAQAPAPAARRSRACTACTTTAGRG